MNIHLTPEEWAARARAAKAELEALGEAPKASEALQAALDELQALRDAAKESEGREFVQNIYKQLLGEPANHWEVTPAEAARRAEATAKAWQAVADYRLTPALLTELTELMAAGEAYRATVSGLTDAYRAAMNEGRDATRRAEIAEKVLTSYEFDMGYGVELRGGRNEWRAVSFNGREIELRRRNSKGVFETRLVDALEIVGRIWTYSNPGNLFTAEKVEELQAARRASRDAEAAA